MLETEAVDDDFFTPVASTSLANIFGNVSKNKEPAENDSLKYIPPKPQNIAPKKNEQPKASQCLFACVLYAHEWSNNVYISKGKLGFAIMKVHKTGDRNLVLYDAAKITLSRATISTKLHVTIKNNIYISYFDNFQKYWSIHGTEEETKKIAELLTTHGANIKYSTYTEQGPPKPKPETEGNVTLEESDHQKVESDTDSSVNRKTKASILNRMANMGHSVLPIRTLPQESSDSSDTNETEPHTKVVRHKPVKNSIKRNSVENVILSEYHNSAEANQNVISAKMEPQKNVCGTQLMPLTNTSVFASSSNDLTMFMSEQRISNSELRININRITDKVDTVLAKMNALQHTETISNTSSNIMIKLLAEYENKIKIYEDLLKTVGMDDKKVIEDRLKYSNKVSEVESLTYKITEIKNENEDKTLKISNLEEEIKFLKDKLTQERQTQLSQENELLTKINRLEENLKMKSKELTDFTNNSAISSQGGSDNIEDKVKNIMNNTFQTISRNFENDENYSGETIKRIIGTVIKKITIETLSEL